MDKKIYLQYMTNEMYHNFFKEYQNDIDLYFDKDTYKEYTYDYEKVEQYIQKQIKLERKTLAIMHDDEIVGEIIIKNIEPQKCATLSIVMKNVNYKGQGYGTQADKLAVEYVFNELDIPTLYADCVITNTRSQHVLEKVGFINIDNDDMLKYYRIDRT